MRRSGVKEKLIGVVTVTAAFLWTSAASAQVFGNQGDAAFGAERLMGIHSDHAFQDPEVNGGPGQDYDVTTLGFGWFAHGIGSPFDIPRLSFDYFIAEHWSLGGALGYQSTSITTNNGRNAGSTPQGSDFIFAPRVGYAHMFGRVVGIWPRAGLTYHDESFDGAADRDVNGFALSAECQFVFVPTMHFAFLLGPSLDLDFTGRTRRDDGVNVDHGYRSLGLQVGLMGWL
jgi:hypothetical protein